MAQKFRRLGELANTSSIKGSDKKKPHFIGIRGLMEQKLISTSTKCLLHQSQKFTVQEVLIETIH